MQAIDGFLIVLDKEANILYVSETIAGHVGLIQVISYNTLLWNVFLYMNMYVSMRHKGLCESLSICSSIPCDH